jgi:hypothetical protein
MQGSCLAAFARRLTRETTFHRLLSPAIADLQSETSSGGFFIGARHYVAIWTVLAWALARDLRIDINTAFEPEALHKFALFGVVLARRRGWGALGGAVQIVLP